jgi:hypothetical protein
MTKCNVGATEQQCLLSSVCLADDDYVRTVLERNRQRRTSQLNRRSMETVRNESFVMTKCNVGATEQQCLLSSVCVNMHLFADDDYVRTVLERNRRRRTSQLNRRSMETVRNESFVMTKCNVGATEQQCLLSSVCVNIHLFADDDYVRTVLERNRRRRTSQLNRRSMETVRNESFVMTKCNVGATEQQCLLSSVCVNIHLFADDDYVRTVLKRNRRRRTSQLNRRRDGSHL